jgi:hypothetical protein
MSDLDENRLFLQELGQLLSNFHSLEFSIRLVLYKNQISNDSSLMLPKDITRYNVGDSVPVNALTDYSSLNILITRFNNLVGRADPASKLDHKLIDLRDSIVHGRIAFEGSVPRERFLMKFKKPNKLGLAEVEASEEMSRNWLLSKKLYVSNEFSKIEKFL